MTHSLKALRRSRGWSQEELASICGLSGRTVQRIENGEAASLETRKALASGLQVSLEEVERLLVGAPVEEKDMTKTLEPAAPAAPADRPLSKSPWLRFAVHLGLYMVMLTWMAFMTRSFGWDPELIPFVALTWAGFLALHLLQVLSQGEGPDKGASED